MLSLPNIPRNLAGKGRAIRSHKGTCHNKDTHERISWNVDWVRTLGFPSAASKSPRNERYTVKTLTSPSPWHNPQRGLGLGERGKTFPLKTATSYRAILQASQQSLSFKLPLTVLSILPFPSICLHKEKQIVNECFGFDWPPKIAFQKNLALLTGFV